MTVKKRELRLPPKPRRRAKVEGEEEDELRRVAYESRCMPQDRVFLYCISPRRARTRPGNSLRPFRVLSGDCSTRTVG